jgi:4-hydroxy-tetrahydrodipicolinate reductase
MSQAIAAIVDAAPDLSLTGVWSRDPGRQGFPAGTSLTSDIARLAGDADVLIDFSLPEGTLEAAAAATRAGTPFVCGVSGLDDRQLDSLRGAAERIPVVYDRNMSQGIAVMAAVVKQVSNALGREFEVKIDETHHVHKLDAPSGTALKLGEAIAESRAEPLPELMWYAEEGEPPAGAIRFHVERRGEVPGEHSVRYDSGAESLTIAHSVTTRDVFALGAVRAARWIPGHDPGLYGMKDVLGLDA